jgi:hypothetical protein
MADLEKLAREAVRLGIDQPIAQLVSRLLANAKQATRACERFRWDDPCDDGTIVELPDPPAVRWELGELVAVTYDATKRGERYHWEHHFESERPVLAFSEESQTLYVVGGDYSVTARGIVG